MDKKHFNYCGHSFIGIRQFAENETFRVISSNEGVPVLDKKIPYGALVWSHEDFYKAAQTVGQQELDLFLMDGKYTVIPTEKSLNIYGEEDNARYRKYLDSVVKAGKIEKQQKTLLEEAVMQLKSVIKERDAFIWNPEEEGLALSVPMYADGYISVDVSVVYVDRNDKLVIGDAVSGCEFVEGTNTFLLEGVLNILCSYIYK